MLIVLVLFTFIFAAGFGYFAYQYFEKKSENELNEVKIEDLEEENGELKAKAEKVKTYNDVLEYFFILASTIDDEPTEEQKGEMIELTSATEDEDLISIVNSCIEKDSLDENDFYSMLNIIINGISENTN